MTSDRIMIPVGLVSIIMPIKGIWFGQVIGCLVGTVNHFQLTLLILCLILQFRTFILIILGCASTMVIVTASMIPFAMYFPDLFLVTVTQIMPYVGFVPTILSCKVVMASTTFSIIQTWHHNSHIFPLVVGFFHKFLLQRDISWKI